MKSFKLIALSIICVLSFCSCRPNYPELIRGKWKVNADASYGVKEGKRIYFSEVREGKMVCEMEFLDKGDVLLKRSGGESRMSKYHFDRDYFFIEGEGVRILKMSNKTMIVEGNESETNDFVHAELYRVDYDSWDIWWKNIKCHVPWWVWIIVIVALVLVAGISDREQEGFWWICAIVLGFVFLGLYLV